MKFLGARCEALNEQLVLCHLSAAHINNLLGTKIDKLIWSIIHTSFTVVNDPMLVRFLLLLKSTLTIRERQKFYSNYLPHICTYIAVSVYRHCCNMDRDYNRLTNAFFFHRPYVPPHHESDTQSEKAKRRQVSSSFISRLTQSSD